MKRRTTIRLVFFTTSICVGLWQAPTLIDNVLSTYGSVLGFEAGGETAHRESNGTSQPVRSFTIFTPQGEGISDEEHARLMGEAQREAPHLTHRERKVPAGRTDAAEVPAEIAALQRYIEVMEKRKGEDQP